MASGKTEMMLLSGRRKLKEITVGIAVTLIHSRQSLKYLGVIFDKDLRIMEHIKCVSSRPGEVAAGLCRLMPNIGRPRSSKRRVI